MAMTTDTTREIAREHMRLQQAIEKYGEGAFDADELAAYRRAFEQWGELHNRTLRDMDADEELALRALATDAARRARALRERLTP